MHTLTNGGGGLSVGGIRSKFKRMEGRMEEGFDSDGYCLPQKSSAQDLEHSLRVLDDRTNLGDVRESQ